jgi:hypothetical protein
LNQLNLLTNGMWQWRRFTLFLVPNIIIIIRRRIVCN